MPLEEALRRACIVHPEARLQENNKLLNWLVVKEYSVEFRKMLYDHPEMMADLMQNVPDFDSITRARQKMQNQCHTCSHAKDYHQDKTGKCSKCSCVHFDGWFTEEEARKVLHTDLTAFLG